LDEILSLICLVPLRGLTAALKFESISTWLEQPILPTQIWILLATNASRYISQTNTITSSLTKLTNPTRALSTMANLKAKRR
jgi:hypothetical protein